MNQIVDEAIVLARTDFGEADRIITVLTRKNGKVRLIAKGVRKPKSKLAGGIELFSTSGLTFIRGKGDIGTLISARLIDHYRHIVKDIDRTMFGYDILKKIHKITEDEAETAYYELVMYTLKGLDNHMLSLPMVELWFSLHVLQLSGHAPNFSTDKAGNALKGGTTYIFDFDAMGFSEHPEGAFGEPQIKLLRLFANASSPEKLLLVGGVEAYLLSCHKLVRQISKIQTV